MIKIPSENNVEVFIYEYQPEDYVSIEELKKMKNYAVKLNKQKDNESLYFGQFSEGKKNGIGIFITQKIVYEGKFLNNEIQEGIEKKKTGIYKGEFKQGKK